MTFEEAGRQYDALKDHYEKNLISRDDFERRAGELVAVGPDGKRWKVDPHAGTWVEEASGGKPAAPLKTESGIPDSLGQLIPHLAKSLVKAIPRMLIIALLMAVLTWATHTYLIARVNDGLMYNAGRVALNSVVHLRQTHFPGVNLFWGVLSYFLTGFFMRAHSLGPHKWFNNIIQLPENIKLSIERSREKGLTIIVAGVLAALLFGFIYRNFMLSLIMAFGMLLIMTAHFQSLETLLLKVSLLDFQRLIKRKFIPGGEEYDTIYLIFLGMCAGFAAAGMALLTYSRLKLLPLKILFTLLIVLLFAGLITILVVNLFNKGNKTHGIALLIILISGGFLLLDPRTVLAWCEGGSLSQAGGSWTAWWGSRNADLVRQLGVTPSVSAFLGSALGSAAAALSSSPAALQPDAGPDPLSGEESAATPEITGDMGLSALQGGPDDNPFTAYEGGDGPGFCADRGLPNYWVNTAILNLVVQDTVYSRAGPGPPVKLTLLYNSGSAARRGMFGAGWSFSYDWMLIQSGAAVSVFKGSGQGETFTFPGKDYNTGLPVELAPPAGCFHRLLYYGDHWLYMAKGKRLIHRFDQVAGTGQARLTRIMDYHGNSLTMGFDARGNMGSLTDAAGRTVTFQYSESGLCTAFSLPDGRTASFHYDRHGNLCRAVDLLGVTSDYSYDAESCLTRMVVGRERKTTLFSYRGSGNGKQLAEVTDARGHTTGYRMISATPVGVRVINPGGKPVLYYSKDGLTEEIVDPLGNSLRYAYQNGKPVSFQDKTGGVTAMEYDERGNLTAVTDPCGHTTLFTYDAYGNRLSLTTPLGETWRYTYDGQQNLTHITSPLGKEQVMEYDRQGRLAAITNPAGVKRTFAYDDLGNLSLVNYGPGRSSRITYDPHGLTMLSRTDARGHTTSYDYDANERLTGITWPDGTGKTFVYNCCAGILTTDENGSSRGFDRDPLLNITGITDSMGNIITHEYNFHNRPVRITDPLGRSTSMDYDDGGRMVKVTNPAGEAAHLRYDSNGNLVSLHKEGDRQINFTFDPCGRLVQITDLPGQSYSVERDPLGRVSTIINGRGERIHFSYNRDGQVTGKQFDRTEAASLDYDAAGNLAAVRDTTGTTSYMYSADRLVEAVEYPCGARMGYEYDPAGNLISATYPGDLQVSYEYDCRNRITRMAWGDHSISFNFDGTGILKEERRSNGTDSVYSHDANYNLTGIKHGRTGSPFVDLQFARNPAGMIIQEQGVRPLRERWDPPPVSATCNRANQLLTWNDDVFSYDADGNLVSIQGGREFKAAYDPESMPVEVTSGGRTTRFTYNGLRQRVRSDCGGQVSNFHYSAGGLLMFETDGTGRVTRRYLYSGTRLAAMVGPEGETLFYHFDHNGSTLALTGRNGKVVAAYDYSPAGAVIGRDGDIHNPFTYVGAWGVIDEGDGLFFMKHRLYDAAVGRFIQKDPVGIAGGDNLYAYAANNPVNYIDPEGLAIPVLAIAFLSFITLAAVSYPVYRAATRLGETNPFVRVTDAVLAGEDPRDVQGTPEAERARFFSDMGDVIDATGDAVLTTNPVSSPGWAAIKGGKSAAEGKPLEVLQNFSGALPGDAGAIAGAAGAVWDACKDP